MSLGVKGLTKGLGVFGHQIMYTDFNCSIVHFDCYFVVIRADFLVIIYFYLFGCENCGFCYLRVRCFREVGFDVLLFCAFVCVCLY
jgi:hypothetical protein